MKDKLRYRYPRGESYLDVIQRFELCNYNIQSVLATITPVQ